MENEFNDLDNAENIHQSPVSKLKQSVTVSHTGNWQVHLHARFYEMDFGIPISILSRS